MTMVRLYVTLVLSNVMLKLSNIIIKRNKKKTIKCDNGMIIYDKFDNETIECNKSTVICDVGTA